MATATVKPVEPVQRTVLLELTEDEALTLVYLAQKVGGSPKTTRRGDVDSICEAICEALGLTPSKALHDSEGSANGAIYFQDHV